MMKKILITFIMLVAFTVVKAQKPDTVKNSGADTSITDKPAVSPEFPGGEIKLKKYLAKTTHYPKKAKEYNTQGTVMLKMLIEEDGTISNIKVIKGVSIELDNEAVRVMRASPQFIPGKKLNGEAIRCYYIFPFKFTLTSVD